MEFERKAVSHCEHAKNGDSEGPFRNVVVSTYVKGWGRMVDSNRET